jgi:TAZ zinc finger
VLVLSTVHCECCAGASELAKLLHIISELVLTGSHIDDSISHNCQLDCYLLTYLRLYYDNALLRMQVGTGTTAAAAVAAPAAVQQPEKRAQVLRQQQQRLLLLRHASKCRQKDGECTVTPHCAGMKKLWKHIAECKDQKCTVPHCVSSRCVLWHYHRCKDEACAVCGPVRDAIQKNHEKAKQAQLLQGQQPGAVGASHLPLTSSTPPLGALSAQQQQQQQQFGADALAAQQQQQLSGGSSSVPPFHNAGLTFQQQQQAQFGLSSTDLLSQQMQQFAAQGGAAGGQQAQQQAQLQAQFGGFSQNVLGRPQQYPQNLQQVCLLSSYYATVVYCCNVRRCKACVFGCS